jgi:hypothetical protein
MNVVETKYQKYSYSISNKDYPTALIWARNVMEEICREILLKHNYKVKPKDNISSYLTEITKNKWVESELLLDFRIVQNYGNFANHAQGREILKIDKPFSSTPIMSLQKIMIWYRNEFCPPVDDFSNKKRDSYNSFIAKSSFQIFIRSIIKRLHIYLAFVNPAILIFFLPFVASVTSTVLILIDDDSEYGVVDRRLGEYLKEQIDKNSLFRPVIVKNSFYSKIKKITNPKLIFQLGLSSIPRGEIITRIGDEEIKYPLHLDQNTYYLMLTGRTPLETLNLLSEFVEDKKGLNLYLTMLPKLLT